MKTETNCDAVMVGRGALGNPWLFKQIDHYFKTGERLDDPSIREKIALCPRHARELCELKGEEVGIKEMRSHACWYLKGQEGANNVKIMINKTNTYEELERLLNDYLEGVDR
jgi:tRNA-dihydrouridine synthase